MLKNLTVGKRISAGFSLIILLAVLVGGVGTWKAGHVEIGVSDLHDTHLPITLLIGNIADTAAKQELAATMYALHEKEDFIADFNRYDALVNGYIKEVAGLIGTDHDLLNAGWLQLNEKVAQRHDAFDKSAKTLIAAAQQGQDKALLEKAADSVEKQIELFNQAITEFHDTNQTASKGVADGVYAASHSSKIMMMSISVVILFVGTLISFFLIRAITKPLSLAINDINEGAVQVAAASGQVSSSSQHLAEGASEQAAGLEETSSSLEEMASMTKQNADNAGQANALMQETSIIVATANDSMDQLTTAMSEVTKASEDTSKIIKTIDEIAFQTNLLALNAAVEAARAGEAGAGFAVVADEVRNLAMRAAAAAKDTAGLIEGTVKQVHESATLLQTTNEDFAGVSQSSSKVSQLINEITSASQEQSRGVDQISIAVAEMDRVTQQNAATAEESASASEELSAQSEVMRATVQDLAVLIGGATRAFANKNTTLSSHSQEAKEPSREQRPVSGLGRHGLEKLSHQGTKAVATAQNAPTPSQVIPMDDDDDEFQNF